MRSVIRRRRWHISPRCSSRQPQFEPLAAGEVITTGTLTAALPVRPGETWSSGYEGLPGVTGLTLAFTD